MRNSTRRIRSNGTGFMILFMLTGVVLFGGPILSAQNSSTSNPAAAPQKISKKKSRKSPELSAKPTNTSPIPVGKNESSPGKIPQKPVKEDEKKVEKEVLVIPEAAKRDRILGGKAFEDGFFDQALYFYKRYWVKVEGSPLAEIDAIQCMLSCVIKLEDVNQAEDLIQQLQNRPKANKTRVALYQADVMLLLEKPQDAKNIYINTLRSLTPNDELYYNALWGLGVSLTELSEWDNAIKVYNKLEDSGSGTRWSFLGARQKILILLNLGKVKEARQEFGSFFKDSDKTSEFDRNLLNFYLLIGEGKIDDALALYKSIKKGLIEKTNIFWFKAISYLVKALLSKKDMEMAINILNEAFAYAPDAESRRKMLLTLLDAYELAQQHENAISTAERFIEYYGMSRGTFSVRMRLAKQLHSINKNGEALTVYNEVIEAAPNLNMRVEAAKEAANIMIDEKLYDEAEKKLKYMFDNTEFMEIKGEALLGLARIEFLRGNLRKSSDLLLSLAENYPECREQALHLAIKALLNLKDYKKVIGLSGVFLKEFEDKPLSQNVRYMNACAIFADGDPDKARKEFLDLATKHPEHTLAPDSLLNAGNIAFEKCDFKNAESNFSTLIEKYPLSQSSSKAAYKRLFARYFNSDDEGAVADVKLLRERYPKTQETTQALLWLGDYYRETGKFDEAEKTFSLIYELYKHDGEIAARSLFEKANSCFRGKQYDKALIFLDELTAKYPDHPLVSDGLFLVGDIYSKKSNYAKAISYYEKAAKRRPGSLFELACWGRLGDCYFSIYPNDFKEENISNSLKYYTKILESPSALMTPMKYQTLYKLAKNLETMGKKDQAIKKYREILYNYDIDHEKTDKKDKLWLVKASLALADLFLAKNNPENAVEATKIYQRLLDKGVEPKAEYQRKIKSISEKYKL